MKSRQSFFVLHLALLHIVFLTVISSTQAGSWQQNVSMGGFNNVHIYTPESNSPIGNGKSLMLVLHGCVQPINNFLTAKLEDAAEEYGMVIAVPDAMNKAGFSCWSYWQSTKSRGSADYKNLISLANTLSGDSARNIDSDQVYIAGLSSGASFANTTACLAPDIFAGMGISAGPSIGTSSNGALGPCESADVKNRCESYAGSYSGSFATQIASIAQGDADTTVNQCYNQQNSDGMAEVYGVTKLSGTNSLSEGTRTAQETLWQEGRVSMLRFNGTDHAWSGGEGASGGYVSNVSINYASYLGKYFTDNNRRVNRNTGPIISNYSAVAYTDSFSISGNAVDAEGSVSNVLIKISALDSGTPVEVESVNTTAAVSDGFYSVTSGTLIDGLYEITAIATDNEAKQGSLVSTTQRIGPEPPQSAPVLSDIAVAINGQCAAVSGNVIDANQNLASVIVNFDNGNVTATLNGNQYSAQQCNLAGGSNTAIATASDTTILSTSQNITFNIDAAVSGDYNLHIAEGHISWGVGFSSCYLAFGTAEFAMREFLANNDQCQWVADVASACAGPVQACTSSGEGGGGENDSDGDGIADVFDNCPNNANTNQADNDSDGIGNVCDSTPDGNPECSEITSSNYSHVVADRATTNGFYTYAVGSGEYMGLYNIFASAMLAETSEGYYELGSCP